MLKEFRDFIARGNVLDLAVAVVIGAAFGKIVTSFVNDLIMPIIAAIFGARDFSDLFLVLKGTGPFATLEAAKEAGAVTLNYGNLLQTIVDFLLVAFAIFLVVKAYNKMRPAPAAPVVTKPCPFCKTAIPLEATRCPACTSLFASCWA